MVPPVQPAYLVFWSLFPFGGYTPGDLPNLLWCVSLLRTFVLCKASKMKKKILFCIEPRASSSGERRIPRENFVAMVIDPITTDSTE
jgi:hypothetical protein